MSKFCPECGSALQGGRCLNHARDPSEGHAVMPVPAVVMPEEEKSLEIDPSLHPALLCSYVYLKNFLKYQPRYYYRDWIMDSGAYSAWNSGKTIDIDAYIATCHEIKAKDPTLVEIIALDVINDGKTPKAETAKKSLENALYMKSKGLEVVPVFHFGEPFEILREYCAAFDKVGLSCRFGEEMADSFRFYDESFHREWPKKFHSFGWMADDLIFRYPFHSFDSASWELGPQCFGNWKKFGFLGARGQLDIRTQVKHYLKLEQQARVRWRKQMEELAATSSPTSRLATQGDRGEATAIAKSLNVNGLPEKNWPTLRLAIPGGAEIYPLALNHTGLPAKEAPVVEQQTVQTVEKKTTVAVAAPAKKVAKSIEAKPMEKKWDDYWKNRGLHRDPRADIQK